MRRQTERGTINFNSNASLPNAIDNLAAAGVESIRVSLNSAQEHFYNAYYRPCGYRFADVVESLKRAKAAGLYLMLNYLVFPGVADREDEIEAMAELIDLVGVDMIQMRNLSLDPVLYLDSLQVTGKGVGMVGMLKMHKARFPSLQYGYFNRTRETFFPPGYQTEWPILS
jgi:molybdenum cofactor biosynthesis enzyme MoaA